VFSPIIGKYTIHKALKSQADFFDFSQYEQPIYCNYNSSANNSIESENSDRYEREVFSEDNNEDELAVYQMKYPLDDSGHWSDQQADCGTRLGDHPEDAQGFNGLRAGGSAHNKRRKRLKRI
jgi:hypothetical protein